MKKAISFGLACVLLAALLAGCAQTGKASVTVRVEAAGEAVAALEKSYETDAESVEALIEANAAGLGAVLTDSDYGKYVEGMNGYTADAAKKEYWAFYVNGESSETGLRDTPIADGDVYSFRLETF